MTTKIKIVYLTQTEFEKDLEICLTILKYPSKQKPYYTCEYFSASLHKSIVEIHIKK